MGFTWESVEELASLHDEPEWLRGQCRAAFGVYESSTCPRQLEEWRRAIPSRVPIWPPRRDLPSSVEFGIPAKLGCQKDEFMSDVKELTEPDVIEKLRECYDPEIPVNIVDLGLIYEVNINPGRVDVKMNLTRSAARWQLRHRMSVRFYLTAMLFIIFDIEAVFFYPWAVVLRALSWTGWIEMFIFMFILMLILLVTLSNIWRKGGLEWD